MQCIEDVLEQPFNFAQQQAVSHFNRRPGPAKLSFVGNCDLDVRLADIGSSTFHITTVEAMRILRTASQGRQVPAVRRESPVSRMRWPP